MCCSYLSVHLQLNSEHFNVQGLMELGKMPKLKRFHFAPTNTRVQKLELKQVSLCLVLLPGLSSVGRHFELMSVENSKALNYLPKYYHDVWGFDCPLSVTFPRVVLLLDEIFVCGRYWSTPRDCLLLPKLKRLHIYKEFRHEVQVIPDTVSELCLYSNSSSEWFDALTSRLRVLTLHKCNLLGVPSGGILALCPNLEVLNLHSCSYQLSDIALNVDMSGCKLRKLTIHKRNSSLPEGLLSHLLEVAPLLEHVHVSVPSVPVPDVQQLVQLLRTGLILQKITFCHLLANSAYDFYELLLAVQAFCPNKVDVNNYLDRRH